MPGRIADSSRVVAVTPSFAAIAALTLVALAGCAGSKSPAPTQPGSPTSIEITEMNPVVAPGTTHGFQAIARYGDGTSLNVTASSVWSTSDEAVMTISNAAGTEGRAARSGEGAVTVTATRGALTASVAVSVWPTVLTSAVRFDPSVARGFAIGRLAADVSAVFWAEFDETSGGSIRATPKAGAAPITLASGLGGINALASDGVHVYWTEYVIATGAGAVKRVPVGGGVVEVLASGTPAGSSFDVFMPGGIALDATSVYWGEATGGGAIRRVPKAGGTVADLGRGQGFGPSALAIQDGHLYGVTNGSGAGVAARLSLAGGTVEVLATGVINAANLAIDSDAMYWAELVATTGTIKRLPLAGGTPLALASSLDNPHSVAVLGDHAYYTGASGSGASRRMGVWKVPVAGGSSSLVLANAGDLSGFDPLAIAVDGTHVYVVDAAGSTSGQGRVLRAPRE